MHPLVKSNFKDMINLDIKELEENQVSDFFSSYKSTLEQLNTSLNP